MTLFKTVFWSGVSTFIRIVASFFSVKVLAVFIGPVGFAMMGQFQNFVAIVLLFSGNLIQTGVVKYVAEFKDDLKEKEKILSTAFGLCLITSFLICILLFIFAKTLTTLVFKDIHLTWLIYTFGLALFFYVFNTFLISILNGEGQIKRMTLVNILSSFLGLFITIFLAKNFGLPGALLAQVVSQSVIFFLTFGMVIKSPWFKWQNFCGGIFNAYMQKFLKFAAMSLTANLMIPLVQLVIREYIGHALSWEDAGYWQAVTRISDAYLLLISSSLSVYYLPKLSSFADMAAIKKEMLNGYRLILPIVIGMALLIFLFRKEIILILFTPNFLPIESLFIFQMIGDVLKIGSWLLVYNMLAKNMASSFIISEIFFSLTYIGFSILFINIFGLIGVTMAFALNYLIYWSFMGAVFCGKYFSEKTEKMGIENAKDFCA